MDDHFSLSRAARSVLGFVVKVMAEGEPSDGEWDQIRAALFRALRPFDEARRAVRQSLSELQQLGEFAPL
ncbi:MAG: hypothetical protein ABJF23_22385 [Bryobacteraceae bacterium]